MGKSLIRRFVPLWQKHGSLRFKRNRLKFIDGLLEGRLFDPTWLDGKRILEVGCANGVDFLQFFKDQSSVELTGVDITDYGLQQENVTFIQADAEELPFEDKHFDLCCTFGVLEHIQPIEKLCRVITEIERVSKSYLMLVPSVSTRLEPHMASFRWQLKPCGKKKGHGSLNYFSDDAWLKFEGFEGAKVARHQYIPLLVTNTIIYKAEDDARDAAA